MKLYMHPVSMTSRPVLLFVADNEIDVEQQLIDLMSGEHHKEPYIHINPNRLVPVLDDGDDFRLTESSTILKYLADKIDSPAYPKDLKKRAKVNEMMDWTNTNFYRDWGYNFIYPQIFPHHKRPTDEIQKGTIAWGKERSATWLQILNDHFIGDRKCVCGDTLTIADYFAIGIVSLGEIIRVDFSKYPNVDRWMKTMKEELPSWKKVNEGFYGFADAVKDQPFESL